MGEDNGGNVAVVQFGVFVVGPTEEAVGELAACGDGDGGEFDFAADVAEGVYAVDVCVLVVVGDDLATLGLFDAGFVEAEIFDFRVAADGPEKDVEVEGAVFGGGVGVVQFQALFCLFDFGLGGVAVDDDTLALIFADDFVLDHGVEGAEEFVVTDEQVSFGAKVVEHACHFHGDVACSY